MSGLMKELTDGLVKKFEVLSEFFTYKKSDIDFKTRIDEYEINDMTYLHILHDYFKKEWNYDSPIENYLERKKRLRVSRNGEGRKEMTNILMETIEEDKNKTNWEKLIGQ